MDKFLEILNNIWEYIKNFALVAWDFISNTIWPEIQAAWNTASEYVTDLYKNDPKIFYICAAILVVVVIVIIIIASYSKKAKRAKKSGAKAPKAENQGAGEKKRDFFLEGEYDAFLRGEGEKKKDENKELEKEAEAKEEGPSEDDAPVYVAVSDAEQEKAEQDAPKADESKAEEQKQDEKSEEAPVSDQAPKAEDVPVAPETKPEEQVPADDVKPEETKVEDTVVDVEKNSKLEENDALLAAINGTGPVPSDLVQATERYEEKTAASMAPISPIKYEKIEIIKASAKKFGPDNLNTTRSGRVYTEEELDELIRK